MIDNGAAFLEREAPNSDYSRVVADSVAGFREGQLVLTKDRRRNGIVKAIVTAPSICVETAAGRWMWYRPEDLIPEVKP